MHPNNEYDRAGHTKCVCSLSSTRLWLTKRDKSLTVCNGRGMKFITVHLEYTDRMIVCVERKKRRKKTRECAARAALWITRFPLVADPTTTTTTTTKTTTSSISETCTSIPLFFILKRTYPPHLRSFDKIQGQVKNRPCSKLPESIERPSRTFL
ncbi:hypothetical protein V1477_009452 [Vespula maculifrons]|uniref:Uncharacterized protein n=1 Tax=Vespula maculifrons TaxID=7453 RepID=A0ABD2C9V0_VESMC